MQEYWYAVNNDDGYRDESHCCTHALQMALTSKGTHTPVPLEHATQSMVTSSKRGRNESLVQAHHIMKHAVGTHKEHSFVRGHLLENHSLDRRFARSVHGNRQRDGRHGQNGQQKEWFQPAGRRTIAYNWVPDKHRGEVGRGRNRVAQETRQQHKLCTLA